MSQELTHERALELLPWLVNDSLPDVERRPLELHIRDCLVCRAELRSQRELASLVRAQPVVDWSAESDFDALLARIDDPTRLPGARHPRLWPTHRWRAVFAGAAAAGMAVLAVTLWIGLGSSGSGTAENYSVLSESGSGGAGLVDVVFARGVSESQMRALLRDMDITIVAGPSELGRYTVRAVPGTQTAGDTDALIERLRADQRVRFAGPSFMTEEAEAPQ